MTEPEIDARLSRVEQQIRSVDERITHVQAQGEKQLASIEANFANIGKELESYKETHLTSIQADLKQGRKKSQVAIPWLFINLALIGLTAALLSYFIVSFLHSPEQPTTERTTRMSR